MANEIEIIPGRTTDYELALVDRHGETVTELDVYLDARGLRAAESGGGAEWFVRNMCARLLDEDMTLYVNDPAAKGGSETVKGLWGNREVTDEDEMLELAAGHIESHEIECRLRFAPHRIFTLSCGDFSHTRFSPAAGEMVHPVTGAGLRDDVLAELKFINGYRLNYGRDTETVCDRRLAGLIPASPSELYDEAVRRADGYLRERGIG